MTTTGVVVPDGAYRARVRLDLIEKTFLLPNLIRVDTKAPTAKVVSVQPRVFSPDGDRRADRVTVRYTVDERAQGMLYVDGIRLVVGAGLKPAGELRWYGMVDGRSLPARRYALAVRAVDLAGNLSGPVDAGHVRIRYVELTPTRYTAEAGGDDPRPRLDGRRPGAMEARQAPGDRPRARLPRSASPTRPAATSSPSARTVIGRAESSSWQGRDAAEVDRRRRGRGARARDRGRSCGMVVPRADDAEGGGGLLDGRVRPA